MKKVNLFLVAALVAASVMFVGCDRLPDLESPTINVNLNSSDRTELTIKSGESVSVRIDYRDDKEIIRIEFEKVDGGNLSGFPMTSGFDSENTHQFSDTWSNLTVGTHRYNTRVFDGADNSTNRQIVITVEDDTPPPPSQTPLGNAVTFEFNFRGAGNSGNVNPPAAVGMIWDRNPTGTTARFVPASGAGQFVVLSASIATGITFKEDLKGAYDNGTKAGNFETGNSGFPKYLITNSGTTYTLVTMTSLTFGNMGADPPIPHRASISYRQ